MLLEEWRLEAPRIADEVAEEWGLRLGDAYPPGVAGHVVRAELPDGSPAALKVFWPHREALQEADALLRYDGDGAVRLLARNDARSAVLLERCEPGTALSEAPNALDVLVDLLPRLWISPDGFATIEEELPYLLVDLEQTRDPMLKDIALAYLRDLVPTQGERVLVHQDLHGDNVLASERGWLAIDPKPLSAERELALAPIVRSNELGHSKREVLQRLDRLCAEFDLDRERALGWTVAHTVAWSGAFGDDDPHLQAARWLLEEA